MTVLQKLYQNDCGCESKWMNARPIGSNEQYKPTRYEHYANVLTHALAIIPSSLAVYQMLTNVKSKTQYKTSLVYGISLIMLFTVSTLFHMFSCLHAFKHSKLKQFFHYCDRATIYIFIASSYTPWLVLRKLESSWYGEYMIYIIWTSAFLGVLYQIAFHEKYKLLEVIFYLAIGLCPSIVVIDMIDVSGLVELALGGAFYVTGVAFFKSDGRIPFAHAIWHVFVICGAYTHYYAILNYLL